MPGTDAVTWECVCVHAPKQITTHSNIMAPLCICMYAYLWVSLEHNLSEYNRRMEWHWLRFSLADGAGFLELFPLIAGFLPPSCVKQSLTGVQDTSTKNSPGSSVMAEQQLSHMDVTSCQKLRQKHADDILFIPFWPCSVALEQNTNTQESNLFNNYGYYSDASTFLYFSRIQSCTINCE